VCFAPDYLFEGKLATPRLGLSLVGWYYFIQASNGLSSLFHIVLHFLSLSLGFVGGVCVCVCVSRL